ncbi:MAG: glycosyltransferase 87 family protein [Planctomycetota bacterium]
MSGTGRRAGGGWLLALAVLGSAFVVLRSEWVAFAYEPAAIAESDFQLHWAAGQALAEGKDPYDRATVNAVGAATGRHFTPFCAANPLIVRLFGLADREDLPGAYVAWREVNVGLFAVAAVLLALGIRRTASVGAAGLAAALALAVAMLGLNDGTWQAFFYNQTNAVTLVVVFGALLAAQSERPVLEGLLLALAVVAKTSPALLIVVVALAGRRRTLAAAALTLLVLGLVSVAWSGAAVHLAYLDMVRSHLGYAAQVGPGEFNNSLHDWNMAPNGVLSRAADAAGRPAAWARAGAWAVTLAVLALLARATVRRARSVAAEETPCAAASALMGLYALGITAGFLTSSVTWSPHLSLAALPLAWLVMMCGRERPGPPRLLRVALIAAVCAVLFVPLGTFAEDAHQLLDVRLKAAGCVALFALVLTAPARPAAGASCAPAARGGGAQRT